MMKKPKMTFSRFTDDSRAATDQDINPTIDTGDTVIGPRLTAGGPSRAFPGETSRGPPMPR
jgi:hypothetical protein